MKARHVPIRSCVVCRQTAAKRSLLRVVRTPSEGGEPVVALDRTGRANGRGAYVCANADCVEKALKQRRFERSLRVGAVAETAVRELREAVTASADAVISAEAVPTAGSLINAAATTPKESGAVADAELADV